MQNDFFKKYGRNLFSHIINVYLEKQKKENEKIIKEKNVHLDNIAY
jgi:hypothetical protein